MSAPTRDPQTRPAYPDPATMTPADILTATYEAIAATDPGADMTADERGPGFDTWERRARHYAYTLPHRAVTFSTVREVQQRVGASGSHFWDRDAVRHFRGRTDTRLYGGRFWVESRRYVPDAYSTDTDTYPREYAVAYVSEVPGRPDAVLSVERIGRFLTLDYARRACATLADAVSAAVAAGVDGSSDR